MSVHAYPVEDRLGEAVQFTNGEYLRCEQGRDSYHLAWSSSVPMLTVLDRATSVLANQSEFLDGYVRFRNHAEHEGTGDSAVVAAQTVPDDVIFIRLDAEDCAFGWTREVGRAVGLHQAVLNECAYIGYRFDPAAFAVLLRETATESLGKNAEDAVDSILPLLKSHL